MFGPLGDLYAELYWDLLASLYACEFEREPFVVARVTAIEAAESVIRDSPVWISRRQELEESIKGEEGLTDGLQDEADVVRALARRLITRV